MISIKNLSSSLGSDDRGTGFLLGPLSLNIKPGIITGIIGTNGAGKTTLLRVLAGQLPIESGQVQIDKILIDKNSNGNHGGIDSLFLDQDSKKDIIPSMSLEENMLISTIKKGAGSLKGSSNKTDHDMILKYLSIVPLGLAKRKLNQAGTLSGGERQVLVLARALALNPSLLLLDEFVSALATNLTYQIMDIVKSNVKQNSSYTVLVTHDIDIVLRFCDEILFLNNGKILTNINPANTDVRSELADLFSTANRSI